MAIIRAHTIVLSQSYFHALEYPLIHRARGMRQTDQRLRCGHTSGPDGRPIRLAGVRTASVTAP